MSDKPLQTLLIEDNAMDVELVRALLRAASRIRIELTCAPTLADGLNYLQTRAFDAVLLDLILPDSEGVATLTQVQAQAPQTPVVVLTGLEDETLALSAVQAGAQDYLVKGQVNSALLSRAIFYAVERKRVEQALRESLAKYKVLFEAFPLGITISDPDGNIIESNRLAEQLLGLTREEHERRTIDGTEWQIVRADGSPMPAAEYASVRALNEQRLVENVEMGIVKEAGQTTWISVTAAPLPLAGYGVAIAYGDITERRRAEQALTENQTALSALIENTDGSIWSVDTQYRLLTGNRLFHRNVSATLERELARGESVFPDKFPPAARAEWQGYYDRALRGEHFQVETLTRFARVAQWVEYRFSPIVSETGAITGVTVFGRDITAQKQAEALIQDQKEELAAQNQELLVRNKELTAQGAELARTEGELLALNTSLEQKVLARTAELSALNAELANAMRSKDEFLASMSHELRTPLTGILGLSEALQMGVYGQLNPRQSQSLRFVEESGRHLLALISDVLDLAKVEAGKLELSLGTVAVPSVCQASLRLISQTAQQKTLKVTVELDQAVAMIQADERRLTQILVNLLGNAVKFTPPGGQVGLKVTGDALHRCARFTVWDTGIGILPEALPRLFQPFVQLDARLAREYAGTGLGLSLVRRMVELHGGSVSVESEGVPGQGSRFTVSLPWEPDNQPPRPAAPGAVPPAPAAPARPSTAAKIDHQPAVLVVEDNAVTLKVLADYLQAQACRVTTARDGAEAIMQAQHSRPDLILMDIQMPGMNGLEAIRRLRANPDFARVPIVALTALAMRGDREHCLAAGASYYMSKPVSLETLAQIMNEALGPRQPDSTDS